MWWRVWCRPGSGLRASILLEKVKVAVKSEPRLNLKGIDMILRFLGVVLFMVLVFLSAVAMIGGCESMGQFTEEGLIVKPHPKHGWDYFDVPTGVNIGGRITEVPGVYISIRLRNKLIQEMMERTMKKRNLFIFDLERSSYECTRKVAGG